MKVLMFGWEFPPHISGGLGTACQGLLNGFQHIQDVDITFVVPKAFGDEDAGRMRIINAEDVELNETKFISTSYAKRLQFIEINSLLLPYLDVSEYKKRLSSIAGSSKAFAINRNGKIKFSGGYGSNLFEEIINYAYISAMLAIEQQLDIIHAHDWLTFPAGIIAKKISDKPLVIHVHATDFDRSGGNVNPTVYWIEKWGMDEADRIITVSNLTRKIVIEKYNINPNKVVTVHNAVEPAYYHKPRMRRGIDEKIVTFLGRITMQKGPEYFVEAANKVLKKMNNVHFVMAGSGDMLNRMITRIARLGISHRFHFTGFLKGDDVHQMFSMSDLYVMPSVSEPFGISPLEAMLSNVPVIISKQSGVAEILKHALKINFWDIDAMADAMYGVLNYEALSKTFKQYGKAEVQSFKWDNSARKIKIIYDQIVK